MAKGYGVTVATLLRTNTLEQISMMFEELAGFDDEHYLSTGAAMWGQYTMRSKSKSKVEDDTRKRKQFQSQTQNLRNALRQDLGNV